ncbi:MAG: tRNA uridine-5-carboxymethylaminomethyl(34) synthesis GTPase MnmE [Bacilli bacterium]|nr:tRNA uridine-5-carboxymethylaminomethyl(34) synthesis GTPase MnmE [Bacilli bacterium]
MEDTIAAISTALGIGAISIIRISGEEALSIVNKVFSGKDLTKVPTHTIHYGFIIDKKEKIDEVLVSVMKSPKTFTKENIVEINCHGGIAATNKVLELLILNGCRLAEPGEFTKRAFLNGRIDLIESSAIMDLIEAKTELARKLSINNLIGNVSNMIKEIRKNILSLLANIEVNIDYPEYEDIEEITVEKIKKELPNIKKRLEQVVKESASGKIIKEGINTIILGKPNVGKSSLLNCLLNEEKAIVTDIAGTTRDVVEGIVNIDGILLKISDTAGIRKTQNKIEKIGVEKSLSLIEKADLILFVLNNNETLTEEDKDILKRIKNKRHIIIINKIDLESKLELEEENIIRISAKENINITLLKEKIKELFNLNKIETKDLNYLTNAESLAKVKKCINKIEEIEEKIDSTLIDMLEIDLKEIWNLLGEVTGEIYQEELIDNLFKQFCLGK